MKLRKAIATTIEDWFWRDPEMARSLWVVGSLVILPLLPVVAVVRWIGFEDPVRNPDFRKR